MIQRIASAGCSSVRRACTEGSSSVARRSGSGSVFRSGARRGASSSLSSAPRSAGAGAAPSDGRLVLYRGPAAMRPALNVLCGGIFVLTGVNVAYIAASHLSWPIFSRDPENNPPKLLPLGIRYAVGMGTFLLGLGSGYFFFLVPMRSITRITVQPARNPVLFPLAKGGAAAAESMVVQPPRAIAAGTTMVHIRTAIPSFTQLILPAAAASRVLPANLLYSLRTNGWFHPDAQTRRDRVVPLDSVFRFLGKASDGLASHEAARRNLRLHGSLGPRSSVRERQSVLLRVGRSKIAYTLESEGGVSPAPTSSSSPPGAKPHNLYKVMWANIKHSLRGNRDDADPTEAEKAGRSGPAATPGLSPKEPWFLDRARFDQLFPAEKYAKKR